MKRTILVAGLGFLVAAVAPVVGRFLYLWLEGIAPEDQKMGPGGNSLCGVVVAMVLLAAGAVLAAGAIFERVDGNERERRR